MLIIDADNVKQTLLWILTSFISIISTLLRRYNTAVLLKTVARTSLLIATADSWLQMTATAEDVIKRK